MLSRREFGLGAMAAFAPAPRERMSPTERVSAVLKGRMPDRAPFCFWHHFHDENQLAVRHAASTLDYQRRYHLDFVKVMSDYPYPKGASAAWYELKPVESPFPEQLKALALIRDGLAGQKYFVETQFNPWNVAEKLSSPEAVRALMHDKPQALLDALEAIARSEANHVKAALEAGASGVFLSIANAQQGILTLAEYRKYSEPFDRMVLEAAKGAPMNTLHLHGPRVILEYFWKGWNVPIVQYSVAATKFPMSEARRRFSGVLMGGLDEGKSVTAPAAEVEALIQKARVAAPKWICAPGCSIPDDATDAAQLKLSRLLHGRR